MLDELADRSDADLLAEYHDNLRSISEWTERLRSIQNSWMPYDFEEVDARAAEGTIESLLEDNGMIETVLSERGIKVGDK